MIRERQTRILKKLALTSPCLRCCLHPQVLAHVKIESRCFARAVSESWHVSDDDQVVPGLRLSLLQVRSLFSLGEVKQERESLRWRCLQLLLGSRGILILQNLTAEKTRMVPFLHVVCRYELTILDTASIPGAFEAL